MWDRRVVRGNTYASQLLPSSIQQDPVELQKQAEKKKVSEFARRHQERLAKPSTPEPVEGRKHMDIQTDVFLEEISDRPVEADVGSQTDAFMDRPPSPMFVPMKTGVDVETQIEDADLFDFDFEVEPILEVLVGKTLEQSLMEVLEEEELANMRAHEDQFDQIRAAELAEAQRMEAAERRRFEEKENRLKQERERLEREREVSEKVAARSFARRYVGDVMSTVFDGLADTGFFYDPMVREIEEEFMPWMMDGMREHVSRMHTAMGLVQEIVDGSMSLRAARTEATDKAYAAIIAERQRIAAEKAAEEARLLAEAAEAARLAEEAAQEEEEEEA
eukprot:CAMPEP_0114552940 /NCGR_PEP_ID=MMETSP0114-20121206/7389_1 /TAXON_ID=31324 /ORGANISM="Goniomonas sp, Strain m" /LENGTH=332 /DNA_ID=CAMNT_0001737843 /DNA_START=220 /DNA_END=1218 /DNA_ORIENTATION=+